MTLIVELDIRIGLLVSTAVGSQNHIVEVVWAAT